MRHLCSDCLVCCLLCNFWLISAKDTAVHPAEGEELHESFMLAFPMTSLHIAQFLLLRKTGDRERSVSYTPAGANMKNRKQV